jgi:hypothetical protein
MVVQRIARNDFWNLEPAERCPKRQRYLLHGTQLSAITSHAKTSRTRCRDMFGLSISSTGTTEMETIKAIAALDTMS